MFSKWYDRKRTPAQEQTATHVVRDNRTRQVIASGTLEKCLAFRDGFGMCYVEEAA